MKPALAFNSLQTPTKWHELPNGKVIAKAIDEALCPWWPRMFGYHLLKVGPLSAALDTSMSAINHQVTVLDKSQAKSVEEQGSNVFGEIDDLPFVKHSVDVALLSHCLEFAVDPHHIIREVNRVVIPTGYLVITGFNPISLAGLNRFIPFRRHKLPWGGRFFTPMRIKDWLHLMGYEIMSDQRVLPFSLEKTKNLDGWFKKRWQSFANNFCSPFGSVYVIVAKKRQFPLTPIKPKWQVRAKFSPINASTLNSRTRP